MPIDNSSRFPKPLAADLQELSEGMAIVINGDTAPKAITSGQYLFIKNHSTLDTGGYHATAAIASGADITSSNVTADADGIVNGAFSTLSEQIGTLNGNITTLNNSLGIVLKTGSQNIGDIMTFGYVNWDNNAVTCFLPCNTKNISGISSVTGSFTLYTTKGGYNASSGTNISKSTNGIYFTAPLGSAIGSDYRNRPAFARISNCTIVCT